MCDTSNVLVRSLVIWDHTVLPATRQRWFSRLYPGTLPVLIYRPRKDERLSWHRWLVIPRWFTQRWSSIQVLSGPDVELIETNVLPLSQGTTWCCTAWPWPWPWHWWPC